MKSTLLDRLACPLCNKALMLQEVRVADGDKTLEGALECLSCHEKYPICKGIPYLLPPEMGLSLRQEMEGWVTLWK